MGEPTRANLSRGVSPRQPGPDKIPSRCACGTLFPPPVHGGVLCGASAGRGRDTVAAADSAHRDRGALRDVPPTVDGDVLDDPAWAAGAAARRLLADGARRGRSRPPSRPRSASSTPTTRSTSAWCAATPIPRGIVVSEQPARLVARRDRQLPDRPRHLPRPAERVRLRHQPRRPRVRRPGHERGRGRRRERRRRCGRLATGFNKNWDGAWVGADADRRLRLERGVRDPVPTLRYDREAARDVGPQLPAQHPPPQRAVVLGAAPPPVQPVPRSRARAPSPGLEPPSQRNLKLLAVRARGDDREAARSDRRRDSDGDVGGDLKWSVTPSLTLDATVNTDFAQVEVDEQQINLDRFNLFFPEKRPFFLENAGFFTVGVAGRGGALLQPPDRHRARRRGGADPRRARGSRARLGGFNVGLLDMQTRAGARACPAEQLHAWPASRASCRTARGSAAIFVNRAGTGDAVPGRRPQPHLRGRRPLGHRALRRRRGLRSRRPTRRGSSGRDHAFNLRREPTTHPRGSSTPSTPRSAGNFNPEVGFLARRDYRKPAGVILLPLPPRRLPGAARGAAARLVPRLLEAGRLPGVGLPPRRQPPGVEERLGGPHRRELHARGRAASRSRSTRGSSSRPGRYDNTRGACSSLITNQGAPLSLETRVTAGRLLRRQPRRAR